MDSTEPLPQLNDVLAKRGEIFTEPTPAVAPRIGVPDTAPQVDHYHQDIGIIASTSRDLNKIADSQDALEGAPITIPFAIAVTLAAILGGVMLVLAGIWLFNTGMAIDLSRD